MEEEIRYCPICRKQLNPSNFYTFKDGKKDRVEEVPELEIELYGTDNEGNDAWISFMIDTDVNYLNSLLNVPTDITNRLTEAENFIKRPNNDSSEFLDFNLPKNNEDDMYKQLTSLSILKLQDNELKSIVSDII